MQKFLKQAVFRPEVLKLWARRLVTAGFLALVVWLLINHAQKTDWEAVKTALAGYSPSVILMGCALALASYLAYASYDLFGRYYVKHDISLPGTMKIAFICCAFTLNLGALIGSLGFRYKLYSQRGVGKGDIAHIVGMSLTTNWLGYGLLAGIVFVTGNVSMPFGWPENNLAMTGVGALLIGIILGYLGLCLFGARRSWNIRGQVITLPSIKIAILQMMASCAHWLFMCAVIFIFLNPEISFFYLLGVLLISSIAGIITHVPGALGVLEAVFLALLADKVDPARILAALIAYRAVFYLLPLALALVAYLVSEIAIRRLGREK
ncbi:lysylphosphatidylglycerol synthase transmembrane domain-containing protein [Marinobacter zhanjiangensis]|uniref:Membrane protein n=1 Tax=Marinobacter zhanjiangensis TaxID=578215 RepID=A0ABQ3AR71_9GAMM|nr:YbhN family protein [Marinobacter zhanjiangensis]GGY61380.1 membrane protein [Marinobacter zhanjiangensis]